ncbi:DUF441 domain-containing protein [Providencia sp. PROV188]|uniref:UPF0756 membrane protein EC835_103358 n=2 Tax=Providencia TaxID=586 RepID=A0A4R3NLN6_9GAMM|nr:MULTISPECIES: DUF441 domain-containing protein [Providencia]ETS99724.1 PF04284 family protein [Providencia alcalifaciens PAL-3]EUD00773.1 PF04284 family protein [Providencia alcalifaciens PAL-1]MBC5790692.1 DUF441 domain-containing protein [Providencia sp. JUb39]MBG5882358.1 DUF441 domain-containing protein [Providencia alcalifaciens]MBS0923819.1 DUF441 domain-containing protein [Providencia sp. JGM181]
MSQVDPTLIILLVLAGLGIISHNMTVTLAMLFLLVVRITPLNNFFPWVEKYGLTIGILILTIGVMAPIASGKISANDVLSSFLNWKSLLAIVIGILVSWLGSRGVALMGSQPSTVAGLLVGTVIGVALFRGVPVGPLIAAGILSLLIGKS